MRFSLQDFKTDPLRRGYEALIFLFPLGAATVQHWATVIFYLLLIFSLFVIFRRRSTFSCSDPAYGSRPIFWGYGIFFVAAALSFVNSDDLRQGLSRLDPLLGFLMFIPIFLGVRYSGVDLLRPYLKGLLLSCIILCLTAFYSTGVLGFPRAKGYYHPIIFGEIAVISGLAGISLLFFKDILGSVYRWTFVALTPVVLYAGFLSRARGAWMAIPFVIPLFVYLLKKRGKAKTAFVTLGLALLLLAGGPFLFKETVGTQFWRTADSIEKFISGEERNTSLGQRFLMWNIAIDVWQDNPVLGSGLGDFMHETKGRMDRSETELRLAPAHAHSIYMEYLATTGLIGFSAMIAGVLIIPLRFFRRHFLSQTDARGTFCAFVGIVVLGGFAVFGFSEVWLARSVLVKFFLINMLVFLSVLSLKEDHV